MNSRSKLLGLLISVGVVVSMALFSLAGIAKAAPAKHTAHKAAAAKVSNPRCKHQTPSKGSFTYSDNQFPDNLNPDQTTLVVSYETLDLTFDSILNYNNKARLYADMVTKIPSVKNGGITNGGKTYTWHLKPGMQWSNGTEVTSKDWKFGWQVYSDSASGPACTGSCDVISRIDTPDKYTVVEHLKRVDASFLTGAHYAGPVIHSWPGAWSNDPHAAAEKLFQDTSFNYEGPNYPTNGPYQVAEFVNNDRIVSHPMKYYNVLSCGGAIKNMIFSYYSDPTGEIAAAAQKATDLTQDYTLSNDTELKAHKQYKLYQVPGFQIEHMELNSDATYNGKPNPLHNIKVRQAIALAVNKVADLQSALAVSAKTAKSLVAYSFLVDAPNFKAPFADPQLLGQWDPLAKKYIASGSPQAVKDAKKLLSQAGFSSGLTVDFDTTTAPYRVAEMSALSKSLENVGIKVNQNPVPASKFFGQFNEGGTLAVGAFQIGLFTWQVSPDPDGQKAFFEAQYIDRKATNHSPINQNYAGVTDPHFTTDFTKADKTLVNKQRYAYYKDAQVRLNQGAYWVPFYYRPVIATFDGRITPFLMNPTSAGLLWNAPVWKLAK